MRETTIPEETLGERLQRARKHAGLGVQRMADELEVSRNAISAWENGRERPRRGMILAYALRCGVPIAWLEVGSLGVRDEDWRPDPSRRVGDDEVLVDVSVTHGYSSHPLRLVA
jgi:transcriptional regulator with XRE-family HTH domain